MRVIILTLLFFSLVSCNRGELESLQNELEAIQSELDDAQSELSSCNYDLEEAQQKLSNLEDYSFNLDNELSTLKNRIDDFLWQDWQTNVYSVQSQYGNVRYAFDQLAGEF